MDVIKLLTTGMIILIIFSRINSEPAQLQLQKAEAAQTESTHVIAEKFWTDSLQEWGFNLGSLLVFCCFVRYLLCYNIRPTNLPEQQLNPWEYINASGRVESMYSTSISISRHYPSFLSKDNAQVNNAP